MLSGTTLKFDIFAPTLDNKIIQTVETTISDTKIEINNSSFFDIYGDPYNVAPAQFDVTGAIISYSALASGRFSDVPSDGFNGWVLTFDAISSSDEISIKKVRLLDDYNTLELPSANISTDGSNVAINVDGIYFSARDSFRVVLDMLMDGGNGRDIFDGAEGDDTILGKGGSDFLNGGSGRDIIKGGNGSDTLHGGADNDVLYGGKGADTFILRSSGGTDTIRDFEVGDRIQVSTSADDLSDLVIFQRGDHVFVRDDGASLLILHTDISDISEDIFIF